MGLIGGILGTTVGTVGGIIAGNKMNKGYRQQQEIYNQRLADIKAHRDNLYYRDPTQTAENQAAVTQAQELLADSAKRAAASAVVAGGTAESEALAKRQGAEAVANMMQQQAVQGAQQKEGIWNAADQQIDAFSQYLANSKLQQAQQNAKAIATATGGAAQALGGLDFGVTKKGLPL